MKIILDEIQSGKFAREWMAESRAGSNRFNGLREQGRTHQIEEVGASLRGMMPWIQKGKLVDKGAQLSYIAWGANRCCRLEGG